MKRHAFAVASATFMLLTASAAAQPEGAAALLQKIRAEGIDRSQVLTMFDQFVTVIGPRLTGSPEHKAAAVWARDRLASWGLADAKLESWDFGRGWALDRLVVEIVEPRYMPVIAYAEGWSASTPGALIAAPVFIGSKSLQEVTAIKDKLAGAIVLSQPLVTAFVREDRVQPTSSEAAVRIGAPPMPRQGGPNPADARQISQIVREASRERSCVRAPASTARYSCSGGTRVRTPRRRSCSPPSTTT